MAISLVSTTAITGAKGVFSITSGSIAVQSGDVLVVASSALAGTISVSDTGSNTWTTSNTTGTPNIAESYARVSTSTSVTVTVTSTSSTAITGVVYLIRGALPSSATLGTSTTSTSTTPSNGATVTGTYFIMGMVGVNGPSGDTFTADTDTSFGAWTSDATSGTSGGNATSNVTLHSQTKIPSTSASQTYNPTLGTSRAWVARNIIFAPITLITASGTSTSTGSAAWSLSASGNSTSTGQGSLTFYSISASGTSTSSGQATPAPITMTASADTGSGSVSLKPTTYSTSNFTNTANVYDSSLSTYAYSVLVGDTATGDLSGLANWTGGTIPDGASYTFVNAVFTYKVNTSNVYHWYVNMTFNGSSTGYFELSSFGSPNTVTRSVDVLNTGILTSYGLPLPPLSTSFVVDNYIIQSDIANTGVEYDFYDLTLNVSYTIGALSSGSANAINFSYGTASGTSTSSGSAALGIYPVTYITASGTSLSDAGAGSTSAYGTVRVLSDLPYPAGTTSAVDTTYTTRSSSSWTLPAGIQAGDLIVLTFNQYGSPWSSLYRLNTPTGYTDTHSFIGSGTINGQIFTKFADGTESSSSVTAAFAFTHQCVTIRTATVFRRVSQVDPLLLTKVTGAFTSNQSYINGVPFTPSSDMTDGRRGTELRVAFNTGAVNYANTIATSCAISNYAGGERINTVYQSTVSGVPQIQARVMTAGRNPRSNYTLDKTTGWANMNSPGVISLWLPAIPTNMTTNGTAATAGTASLTFTSTQVEFSGWGIPIF